MRTLSDRALRRGAWAVWWLLAVVASAGLPSQLQSQPESSQAWGGDSRLFGVFFGLVILSFPLVGLLILLRDPRNRIGWMLDGIGVVWILSGAIDTYAYYALVAAPGSLPGGGLVAALGEGTWVAAIGIMGTYLILLFPDGRLPSPRWRPLGWLTAVAIVVATVGVDVSPGPLEESPVPTMDNPLALDSAGPLITVVLAVAFPLLLMCMLASAVALVRRFRRSRALERQQMKWLTTAGALVIGVYLVTMAATFVSSLTDRSPHWVVALQSLSTLAFILLPASIGAAVLRYRLYDIDVVINRALVYSALTVMLGTTYLVMVLGLQVLLEPVTDQSDLAVAASTLAVAALFGPARGRIQAVVDRRFYRNRYDAARTLEAFVSQLRHELDLGAVGDGLSAAVRETVQPSHVSLWLRP